MKLDLKSIRQNLHQFPELSGQEEGTAATVEEILRSIGITDIETGIGGHGVLAFPCGRDKPLVMYRCELDALPIQEIGHAEHQSKKPGKMHACGHDGHMAILLGLAEKIKTTPPKNISPVLLFQPAEETGKGALAVLADERFKRLKFEAGIALHNIPGLDQEVVTSKKGTVCMISTGLEFHFAGQTSHAAFPEHAISANEPIFKILEWVYKNQDDGLIITPVHTKVGEPNFGITPGDGLVCLTLRSDDEDVLNRSVQKLTKLAENEAEEININLTIKTIDPFPITENTKSLVKELEDACSEAGIEFEDLDEPFRWSEDFGHFAKVMPILLFGLGSGKVQPDLHFPDYDFPDTIQETGSNAFFHLLKRLDSEHGA